MRAGILAISFLLVGCSTQISTNKERTVPISLQLQHSSTALAESRQLLPVSELRPGDILLSSSRGINSLGIRLFSVAGVSHASVYLGDEQVAEAVGSGVRIIPLAQAVKESNNMLALRYPDLTEQQAAQIRDFSLQQQGRKYNYKGIVMIAPWMLTKRVCEIPLLGAKQRNFCLSTLAKIQLGDEQEQEQVQSFFCSQFVTEAYAQAGYPIVQGNSAWITPADLLHMREGDVSSFSPQERLSYVGHLKNWNLANNVLPGREP
ncbi:YaeF family permuted papain-like enzyme [Enterobacillus tribolii]|uniref:Permuted papain-like amidase YaeF/Yiix C92 family enzyme n=1 Tax=Enterobacillus tribolii TaxID=1487935 RepID=A0A370QME4_9GAMM|nr:YaeF family permuted papain-like enzyme [Enterobacillus tribolii]MBW7982381.1 YaeF family permuted papain-like enzyme [Enterobacillus tribolii]RDK89547.1 permuted papain-like amidase YaeF/Yiix C92 family enzyme [Enterobacillus tribolii]